MIIPKLHGIGAYPKGGQIGPASWPHHDLIIVTRGTVDFATGRRELRCEAGSAFIVPPCHGFVGTAGDHGCVIWVQHFAIKNSCKSDRDLDLPQKPQIWHLSDFSQWTEGLMRRAHSLQTDRSSAPATLPSVLSLLLHALREERTSELARSPTISEARLRSLIDDFSDRLTPPPSIQELTQSLGWSESHLRQKFRRQHGQSLGAWLRDLRMREACRLLRESNLPIKEISTRLGYSDPVSFHRAFTNHHAITPGRFRTTSPRLA